MEINFDWLVKMDSLLIESAEEKLKMYIEVSSHFNPCHDGTALVSILATDSIGFYNKRQHKMHMW